MGLSEVIALAAATTIAMVADGIQKNEIIPIALIFIAVAITVFFNRR